MARRVAVLCCLCLAVVVLTVFHQRAARKPERASSKAVRTNRAVHSPTLEDADIPKGDLARLTELRQEGENLRVSMRWRSSMRDTNQTGNCYLFVQYYLGINNLPSLVRRLEATGGSIEMTNVTPTMNAVDELEVYPQDTSFEVQAARATGEALLLWGFFSPSLAPEHVLLMDLPNLPVDLKAKEARIFVQLFARRGGKLAPVSNDLAGTLRRQASSASP